MKLTYTAEVLGQVVTLTAEISGSPEPSADAIDRIALVMRREAQRFAEIAGVDVRDQEVNREEEKRIAALPADRPAITIAAGTKDPKQVIVHRGEFTIGGKRVAAAKG